MTTSTDTSESNEWRSRGIPWLTAVRFHKEIVARAEQSFFSLNAKDHQAERWSNLTAYEPDTMSGPWLLPRDVIQSQSFRLALEQREHETVFLGGPCYLAWEKGERSEWLSSWRPLFYREVEVRSESDGYVINPDKGAWAITPLIYKLLDQLQLDVGCPLEDYASQLIEKAAVIRNSQMLTWSGALRRAIEAITPELRDAVTRTFRQNEVVVEPSQWVLFAPTKSFSALTRYLMKDYERLETSLTKDPGCIGGLRILDAELSSPSRDKPPEILPVVPLNPLQLAAAQSVIGSQPLTVISGPPGCGKSQVVVSVLLNAWARGMSVLFASNNNKAVDVVRDRLNRFESEFPIAVRAGKREKNNIVEVLRRTLNMAASGPGAETSKDPGELRRWRERLFTEKKRIQELLDSRVPQLTAEALKTALKSYGNYRNKRADVEQRRTDLTGVFAALGLSFKSPGDIRQAAQSFHAWLQFVREQQLCAREDDARREQLALEAMQHARLRDQSILPVNLLPENAGDWTWLTDGPPPELLDAWESKLKTLLAQPLEMTLEPFEWHASYNRWTSADDASRCAGAAIAFAEEIRIAIAGFSPKALKIATAQKNLQNFSNILANAGLEERDEIKMDVLQSWSTVYATVIAREKTKLDFLPFSAAARLDRKLFELEKKLLYWLPLSKRIELGILNEQGRAKLAPHVEILRQWIQARDNLDNLESEVAEVENMLQRLRSKAIQLGIESIPEEPDSVQWRALTKTCEHLVSLATIAADSWRKRHAKETTVQKLESLAVDWMALACGHPLKTAWSKSTGANFDAAIAALREAPTQEKMHAVRSAYYAGALVGLRTAWRDAFQEESKRKLILAEARRVPLEASLIANAWNHFPPAILRENPSVSDVWPDFAAWETTLRKWNDFYGAWIEFNEHFTPKALREADDELKRAIEQLEKATGLLPPQERSTILLRNLETLRLNPNVDWPTDIINESFAKITPTHFNARIEQIDAQLEKGSFEDAKADWIERLRCETAGVQALDSLEKTLRRHYGDLPENELETFKQALPLVPIWITTAQAAQAIPLSPELFDLVIIDEASQCTLTNLLPLLYRGRRLAIIGDAEQLPAIPTIQEIEERALAAKHGLLGFLNIIGHAGNDVYKTATESLPRRRADVLHLNEHFRSNPQIIGFSNRYIYLQRLVLKKDPTKSVFLPVGGGVHRIHVNGMAKQGERGRSWVNEPEGHEVLNLIAKLKDTPGMQGRSIGIVTPFAAQKEWLRAQIETRGWASDIFVDSAYGFQGDERDIVVFSPVVARGITPSASRWVENPPNLINVALTRAREALYVVADFDYCLRQEGLLRKLALYCRDIQTLRDTSPAELELYSWMMVQGWTPIIHPRIADIEADFALTGENGIKVAVEVDGKAFHEDHKEHDKARDAFLQAQGYRVVRLSARAVSETPYDVISTIEKALCN